MKMSSVVGSDGSVSISPAMKLSVANLNADSFLPDCGSEVCSTSFCMIMTRCRGLYFYISFGLILFQGHVGIGKQGLDRTKTHRGFKL